MKTVRWILKHAIILSILININYFHVNDVQAAKKSSKPQKKEASLTDKVNADFFVYFDRTEENKVIWKGYDIKKGEYFIDKEINPNKVTRACMAFWLNSSISICFHGKMAVGERFQSGTFFNYKTQMIPITSSDGRKTEIEILPYYEFTGKGLLLYPIAFVTKMNDISNKVYFLLDSNKDVIEWGIEVNGEKKRQPIEIPMELRKHRMFCVANSEIVCEW